MAAMLHKAINKKRGQKLFSVNENHSRILVSVENVYFLNNDFPGDYGTTHVTPLLF